MEVARTPEDSLTPSQRQAVLARGNVLVMAGAGTGKTKTLVARCLDCLERDRSSLTELLVVTFTEAAAAEMRQRLRKSLEAKAAAEPNVEHWPQQLALFDIAHIGTLHGFCLRLIREHFHELGLDPQLAILDEGEARQRAAEILDEQFQAHYGSDGEFSLAVLSLIQVHGGGRDEKIRALVLRLHNYSQTRPDAAGWLAEQRRKFSAVEPVEWQRSLLTAITEWRDEWLPALESLKPGNEKAAELAAVLGCLEKNASRESAAEVLTRIVSANLTANYPKGKAGKLRPALGDIFAEAAFLAALAEEKNGTDPLAEDWSWVRGHMETLLRLAQEFAAKFSQRKLADGVLDFHDLEQFALKLLWDFAENKPTAVAEAWRKKLRFIFVDEYQDINAAQDKIIAALARDSSQWSTTKETGENISPTTNNRFLVGDVKQSIYGFRLADPKIFRDYARDWDRAGGQVISLAENFRSREALLNFTNSIFSLLMREELGGVAYGANAWLRFGSPATRSALGVADNPEPRAELLLHLKTGRDEEAEQENESGLDELADLGETEKQARLLVSRLRQLKSEAHAVWDEEKKLFRPAEWRDMAVLLRAMSGKSEIYAMEFERAGVPLVIARGGFYESSEISDLLSLLQLLDNPLQDVPCIAVLRSPLVGCSLDELASIRLAAREKHFWTALMQVRNPKSEIASETRAKVERFLERFGRWRKLARQVSLARCLETVLAETHYDDWLKTLPRGAQRNANVGRFLNLAQKFDQFQRQGLFRFLKFIAAQREAEVEPEVSPLADENAVRLMSIHQSKGLEFPIVTLADLAKNFNQQDLRAEIILDEELGLCPKVKPPNTGRRYPSLPHWLAQRRQRREQAGEELRLLYVALTRARDTLILAGSVSEKKWSELVDAPSPVTTQKILSAKSYADWMGIWFSSLGSDAGAAERRQGETPLLRWRIVGDEELANGSAETAIKPINPGEQDGLPHPLTALEADELRQLRGVLTWHYGFSAATQRAAKSSVTALRRQVADELADESEPAFHFPASLAKPSSPKKNRPPAIGHRQLDAAAAGTAHHKFLQHLQLAEVSDPTALAAGAQRLVAAGVLSTDESAVLDLPSVAAFWNSEVGGMILRHAAEVKRELEFTARFSPAELSELIGTQYSPDLAAEFIVVQGVADLVVQLPKEIWLLDFKTDAIGAENLAEKIKNYSPQLRLYARALGKIYARPVTHCWLHFLSAQHTEVVRI
jgi:ATP-dependent helicase/nuclease subunit A